MAGPNATAPVRPIGWVVVSARGGAAMFLERPQANLFATRVRGTVDAMYSGAQLAALLAAAAAQTATQPGQEMPHAAA